MTEKSAASGVVPPYGTAIGNALSKGGTSTAELLALRDHAREIVGTQGDLVAALKMLDAEIANRGAGEKVAPAPASERFVVQIDGLAIPASTTAEIEQAIQKAVMAEIAKLDTRGDFVATRLSQAKGLPLLSPGLPWPPVMGLVLRF